MLHRDHITLAQAVKAAGLAGSGGQAKFMVREGSVTVNAVPEAHPGRKLVAGDCFRVADGEEWTIKPYELEAGDV
jgi:ribosome-associated protein